MSKKKSELELELYDLKWFDYRTMPPDLCTLMFIREWVPAQRGLYKTLGMSNYVNVLRPFSEIELEAMKRVRSWRVFDKLRIFADKHGLRYDLFWKWGIEALLEQKFNKRFANVYLSEKVLSRVLEMHKTHCEHFVIYSKDSYFRASRYEGSKVQKDYYAYLLKEISKKTSAHNRANVIRGLFDRGIFPMEFLKPEISKYLAPIGGAPNGDR